MASRTLVAESICIGGSVEAVPLTVERVHRVEPGDESIGQPRVWTFIAFEVPDSDAGSLADGLSAVLEPVGGWYCDFRTAEETFVVFFQRIFRYQRGNRAARREAENYARSVGVPEEQIHWCE